MKNALGDALVGTVTTFDVDRGIGTVALGNHDAAWLFHCTAITDGTRTIAVGERVSFVVGPGGPGRWEARSVTAIGDTTHAG